MDSRMYPQGKLPYFSKHVAGVLTYFRRSDASEIFRLGPTFIRAFQTKTKGNDSGSARTGFSSNATISGTGKLRNIFGLTCAVVVKDAGVTVGTGSTPIKVVAGLWASIDPDNDSTYTAITSAAIIGQFVCNNSNSTTKLKISGIIVSVFGGDSANATAGAYFKALRQNSGASMIADYGLDLYSAEAGGYSVNKFAVADIRLAGINGGTGLTISSGSGAPTHSVPKGSIYLRSDGSSTSTRLYTASDSSGSWVAMTSAS